VRTLDSAKALAKRNASEILRFLSYYTDISLSKPAGITFDITDRCQSRCLTCAKWRTPVEVQSRELSTQEWMWIIVRMKQWLGEFSFVFAGGEPFLRRDVFRIISFASNIGVRASVISSGYGFGSLGERVIRSGLDSLTVSLNGVTPQVHDVTRGTKGAYHETVKFLKDVNGYRKKLGSRLRLSILAILMPFNCHEAIALAEWVRDEGIDAIRFQPLDPLGSFHPYPVAGLDSFKPEGASSEWYRRNIADAVGHERLDEAITQLISYKRRGYPISNSFESFGRMRAYFHNPREMYSRCKIGVSRFNVDPYGNMRLCFDMEPIGNVLLTPPWKLYHSKRAMEQRRLIRRCNRPCHWAVG